MQEGVFADRKNHPLFGSLMSKIEEIFFFLISATKKHLDEEEIDRIIESPDQSGTTVFRLLLIYRRRSADGYSTEISTSPLSMING